MPGASTMLPKSKIRTRFAPSPTGYLHIGGARTALFAWLHARHCRGHFILRIEDTDRDRAKEGAVQSILDGLAWLGLDYDEETVYQSERLTEYKEVIQKLLDEGKAYYCYCSRTRLAALREAAMAKGEKPKYDGYCRASRDSKQKSVKPVIRFKNPPEGEVVVNDRVQGSVIFNNAELDDVIIARADGSPTYNLTAVFDDLSMGITEVIRGDDHLNNTPRQMNIFQALEASPPNYAHIPLILDEHGKRLSKRHGAANILQYRDQGFLAEAVLNYLVRLGWSHGDQEIFSLAEMVDLFDLAQVNKSAASINPEKLLWLNQHYMKSGDRQVLATLLAGHLKHLGVDAQAGPDLSELAEVQKTRTKTLLEMAEQSRYFFMDFTAPDEAAAKKYLRPVLLEPLRYLREQLALLETWQDEVLHQAVTDTAAKFNIKMGKIAQPLRVAVTGDSVSPSIDTTLRLIGKDRVITRIDLALGYIKSRELANALSPGN